ncbi:MAG: hypothetical protein AAGH81_12280 [Bacteroidota bacterium]
MVPFVDMDGVIADAYQRHIDGYNQEFQGNLSKDACYGKGFWQCAPASHRKSVQNHAGCESFFKDLGVMENSQQVLEKLNQNHTVSIASAALPFPRSLRGSPIGWMTLFLYSLASVAINIS